MIVESGAHSISSYFVLRNAAEHLPKSDLAVVDIDLYYVTYCGAISTKADCIALASPTSEWVANGAYNIGQGLYRIDWPDEAFAGPINTTVQLIVVCFGVDTTFLEVLLSPRMMAVSDLDVLHSDLSDVHGDLSDIHGDLDAVHSDVSAIEGNIDTIKEDVSTIKSSQTGEESNISAIQNDIDTIKSTSMVDLSYVVKMLGGSREIVNNQMIFYDQNGTEIARFDLFDAKGKPSMINVYKRVRV